MNNTPTPRTDERKASFALDTIRQLETELAAVTKERDRLAEALESYRNALYDGPENCSYITFEAVEKIASKALKYLNQPKQ